MQTLWGAWTRVVRHRIFPPGCDRPDCNAPRTARLWQRRPPIRLRRAWLCSPQCVEREARVIFDQIASQKPSAIPTHRVPLGLLMLAHGYVNEIQLQVALEAQHRAGKGKIGEWLQAMNFVTERQVVTALGVQWACPLLALGESPKQGCATLLPPPVLRTLRLMPVRFTASARLLYLALSEKVEYRVLSAIEEMLDCRTVPCLVSDRVMDGMLERLQDPERAMRLFDRISGSAEMARITGSYVTRVGAEEVRIVRCGPYIWVRLTTEKHATDLVFAPKSSIEESARAFSSRYPLLSHAAS
ncbi:MAG: hypothetical protein WA628_15085 [Terriglobales bacterium]